MKGTTKYKEIWVTLRFNNFVNPMIYFAAPTDHYIVHHMSTTNSELLISQFTFLYQINGCIGTFFSILM